jgi:hypothetical protein
MGKKKSSKKSSGKSTTANPNVATNKDESGSNDLIHEETLTAVTDGVISGDEAKEETSPFEEPCIDGPTEAADDSKGHVISGVDENDGVRPIVEHKTDLQDKADHEEHVLFTGNSVVEDENKSDAAPIEIVEDTTSSSLEIAQADKEEETPVISAEEPSISIRTETVESACDAVMGSLIPVAVEDATSSSLEIAQGDKEEEASVPAEAEQPSISISTETVCDEVVASLVPVAVEDASSLSSPVPAEVDEPSISIRTETVASASDEVVESLMPVAVEEATLTSLEIAQGNKEEETSAPAEAEQPSISIKKETVVSASDAVVESLMPVTVEDDAVLTSKEGEHDGDHVEVFDKVVADEAAVEICQHGIVTEIDEIPCQEPIESSTTLIVEDVVSSSVEIVHGVDHVVVDEPLGVTETVESTTITKIDEIQQEKSLLTLFTVMVEDAVTSCQEIFSSEEGTSSPNPEVEKAAVVNEMGIESASIVATKEESNENKSSQALPPIGNGFPPISDGSTHAQAFYTLDELLKPIEGVDWSRREDYLSDDDFKKHLTVTREVFPTLAPWKRKALKQKAGIF